MVDSKVIQSGRYKAYPEYKDSGVEWLGDIPSGWGSSAVWMQFEIGRGRVISNEEIADNDGIYPVYSSQTLNDGIMGYINTYDFDGHYITWTTDGANAGTVFTRSGKFNCTNVCGTLKSNKSEANIRFYTYALSMANKWFVRHDINPKLMNNVISAIRIPVCSTNEQNKIANFLDYETAKLDTLIEKQQHLIELLTEKRQAVISHAVTKGLNPDVPMKDSGVEWLGDVPSSWRHTYLSIVADVIDPQPDHRAPAISEDGEGFPYIGIRDVKKDGTLNFETARPVNESAVLKQEKSFSIDAEDIIFCKVGTLGLPRKIRPHGRCALSATLVLIKPKLLVDSQFLLYVLDSDSVISQTNLLATGSTRAALGIQQIRRFKIPYPKLDEQKKIANFLDNEVAKIDSLIEMGDKQIQLMQERRTALISAAVTGKIDVRDWVKPE